jgi:hypothetical protein
MKELDLEELFAAGAKSVAVENGMSEKDAEDFADRMCKDARPRRVRVVDDDEEEGTWWDRNKAWVIPSAVGLGAFVLGADAGRGRPDRSAWTNVGRNFIDRLKYIFGTNRGPVEKSMTDADPEVLLARNADKKNSKDSDLGGFEGTPPGPDGAYPKGEN